MLSPVGYTMSEKYVNPSISDDSSSSNNYSMLIKKIKFNFESLNIIYYVQNAPMNCSIILCVNKVDLPLEFRQVSKEEYVGFALDHNLDIIEASAASGFNVAEVFASLGRLILSTNRSGLAEVHIDPNEQDKGSIILREFAASKKKRKGNNDCCTIC